MSVTATTSTTPPRPTGTPLAAPRLAQRRRSPKLIALAVALVAVGALVAAYAVTLVGSSQQYLAVSRAVPVGAAISADDLATVRITSDPALRPIPARQANQVIGRYAAVGLVPGTLLTVEHLTSEPIPGPGMSLVPIGLREERQPVGHIRPGTEVTLVAVPASNSISAQADSPPDSLQTYSATVVDVRNPGTRTGSMIVVNVAVAERDAPAVAALAANNRLTIVVRGS